MVTMAQSTANWRNMHTCGSHAFTHIHTPSEDGVWLPTWRGDWIWSHTQCSHPVQCTCICTCAGEGTYRMILNVQLRNATTTTHTLTSTQLQPRCAKHQLRYYRIWSQIFILKGPEGGIIHFCMHFVFQIVGEGVPRGWSSLHLGVHHLLRLIHFKLNVARPTFTLDHVKTLLPGWY